MNAVVSVCLLACALGIIVYLLSRRETNRRSQYGPAGLSEFRTGLALDECFDRLDTRSDTDLFAYECRRENDGSFLLHLTLHQPSQQPLDTLYTLRLGPRPPDRGDFDLYPGGFWLQGAAVPARHAGRIYAAKAGCPPHQMIFAENAFLFARFLLY